MTISVNRTFSNGYESTPKTKSSKAVIDLPFEAIEYFRKQRLKIMNLNKKKLIYQKKFQKMKNININY